MATEHDSSRATKVRVLEAENAMLKARLYTAGRENEECKRQLVETRKELKETRALLGQAVVAESLNRRLIIKRHQSRSPSLELLEAPVLFKREEKPFASPVKQETPLSQRSASYEDNKRVKRRRLNPAPAISQASSTITIDLTLDESDELVPGPSSASKFEKGITNIGERAFVDQSYKAEEMHAFMEEAVDGLPDEGEPPVPSEDIGTLEDFGSVEDVAAVEDAGASEDDMPLDTLVQISACPPISDTQVSNQNATSTSVLPLADESNADLTGNGGSDRAPETSTTMDVEKETTPNEPESHPDPPEASTSQEVSVSTVSNESEGHLDPPQASISQGVSVSENPEVDQLSNKNPTPAQEANASEASTRESSEDLSYMSDISYQSPTPSAWSESSRQTTPSSVGASESGPALSSGQRLGQALASSSALLDSRANSAIVRTRALADQKAFNLSPSVIEAYLQSSSPSPLAISPPAVDIEVSRAFLHAAYGGSDRTWLQYIPAHQNPSNPTRGRHLVFPTLSLNPAMPSRPGLPGLIFASRNEILENPPWTVFCKRSDTSPALWLYLGEYKNTLVGVITPEQFCAQPYHVQNEWATSILTCKKFDVYVAMRARIALRKAGVLPVVGMAGEEKDNEEKFLIETEMLKIKRREGTPVFRHDIITAFRQGEEAINIIRMRCVQYDHVFANDMRRKLPQYSGRLAAEMAKRLERASNTRKKTAMAKRQRDGESSLTTSLEPDEDADEDCGHRCA